MDVNVRVNDPREHINEEPRNDFGDLMMGFVGMFGFMTIIFSDSSLSSSWSANT